MTTDTVLLPCPFCGGEALEQPCQRGISYVLCAECGAESEGDRSKDSIAKWNRRASPSAAEVQALVERCRDMQRRYQQSFVQHMQDGGSDKTHDGQRGAAIYKWIADELAKLIPRNHE